MRTTYEVTTQDGKEVSRTPIAQVVVTKKVDEVVLVGTGEQQAQQEAAQQAQSAGDGQAAQANGGSEGSNSSTPAPATNPGAGTDPDSAKGHRPLHDGRPRLGGLRVLLPGEPVDP